VGVSGQSVTLANNSAFAELVSQMACHGQTTVSDRVQGSRDLGISGEITKMDFEERLFLKRKSVT